VGNRGRSTTGGPAVPYCNVSARIDAARHLRLTVTRYIADRATLADIETAMVMLRAAVPVDDEPGHRAKGGR
jgi:hypothetical protein